MSSRRFLVALSFPGEHRALVSAIADRLAATIGRDRTFYDAFFASELARPNLDTYLQHIYQDQSDLVVAFVCAAYERKEWCGLEWRALRALIKSRRDSDVMLIRLDDGQLSGNLSIDGFLDARQRSSEELAALILERVPTLARSKTVQVSLKGGTASRTMLLGESIIFGRDPPAEADLRAPDDPKLSRSHVRLTLCDQGVVVEDLRTKNGTLVNGSRIDRVMLEAGAEIRCGRSTLVLLDRGLTETDSGISSSTATAKK